MNHKFNSILVIRLSAFGDVILVLPVLKSWAIANPDTTFRVLTKSRFKNLFLDLASNIQVIDADFETKHKGIAGLFRLFLEIKKKNEKIADIHDVLRSKVLRTLFLVTGHQISVVKKYRSERKKLTRFPKKELKPIPNTWTRYNEVFTNLGLKKSAILPQDTFSDIKIQSPKVDAFLNSLPYNKYILIAPFAAHANKMYPLNLMEETLRILTNKLQEFTFLLVGNGNKENQAIEELLHNLESDKVVNISNKFNLDEEMSMIQKCTLAFTMDSANFHLASWLQVPVVSIWGPTHPYAGFDVWKKNEVVQVDLECRPCSIYGNKPCWRGDLACMNNIRPTDIVERVLKLI